MSILTRRLLLWGGAAVLGSAGFAFMASNTSAGSRAGIGAGALSGYTVSNISYQTVTNVGIAGQTYIAAVSFTLTPGDANASNVIAWFENGNGDTSSNYVSGYYSCSLAPGQSNDASSSSSNWVCDDPKPATGVPAFTWGTPDAPTGLAQQLWVSAAQ